MKKLPKKLVWTVGILLGLVIVVVVGLRIFFPAEKVRDMAVAMAGEKLGREISVVDVGLSFAGGLGVDLAGVTVANPMGFAGEPLLAAENIDLKLKLSPLLRGEFRVNRLVVEQPRVRLVRLGDGHDNFTFETGVQESTGEAGTTDDPDAVAVSFDRLEIHGGRLDYHDQNTGQKVELVGLDLAAALTNPGPGLFQSSGLLEVDSLLVSGEKPQPTVATQLDYDLSFDTSGRVMQLTRGDLEINGLPCSLKGNLNSWPDSLGGAFQVQAGGLDLDDILAWLTPEQKARLEPFTLAAEVSLDTDLAFDMIADPRVSYDGQAKITGLTATSRDIEGVLTAREVHLKFQTDKLEVASDGGAFADQPLVLNLTVEDFRDPRVTGSVDGAFDLALVERFLPSEKEAALSGGCRLVGSFSGRTDNPAGMDYAGRAVISDLSYADKTLPDTLEKLNGTVSFDTDSVVVEKATALFGGGDVTLTGKMVDHLPYFLPAEKDNRDTLKKPTFTFVAHSNRIDIDRLYPPAAPGAPVSGDRPAVPDTHSLTTIPDLLGQGTIKADTLIYSRVPFTMVTGSVRLQDRILKCYDMSAGVYGGGVTGQVAIDLNDLDDPGYGGEFEAVDIEANNFLTRFTDLKQVVSGKAGLSGSFGARGRAPDRIKSTLTMDSIAALTSGKVVPGQFVNSALSTLAAGAGQSLDKEQALKDLTTLIKVENGRVGMDQFQTKLGSFGDLTLAGSYGFAGDLDYQGALLLTEDQTARLYATGGLVGSVANLFGDQAARLSLPISVNGTMDSPKMDIDYSELTDNLKSQFQEDLTDELKDRLKGLFGK